MTAGETQSPRERRVAALNELRKARGSDALIAYVTSTRPGLSSHMSLESFRYFMEHVPSEKVGKLDLLIHSNGGDGTMPWRLMTFLREYAEEVHVLVPHCAFSAATLAALGADRIVMHQMAMLGPIDPTILDPYGPTNPQTGQPLGVSVEDVAAYIALVKDDVGIRHEDELVQAFSVLAEKVHPLTLGQTKRGTSQARMLGEKLLRLRDPQEEAHKIEELIDQLTTKLYYHGHPISRSEARDDLGLHVDYPSTEVEAAMWDVYRAYEDEMLLYRGFDPIGEAISTPKFNLQQGKWSSTPLPAMRLIFVESEARADVLEQELNVTLKLEEDGTINANLARLRLEWVIEN